MATLVPVRLLSAGSLSAAARDLIQAFTGQQGVVVEATFGPAGLLRERIEEGEAADLFASASLEHAQILARAGRSAAPVIFARNALCALVRPGLAVTPDTLLDRLLDPAVRLGTSTPGADPSGDYAWDLFARAGTIRPGARTVLETKALKLVGGRDVAPAPPGRHAVGWHMAEGRADIFLSYRTTAAAVLRDSPGTQVLSLPQDLAVGADYALALLSDHPGAARLAFFILSPEGQAILDRHGFVTVTEARSARRG
ncbi:molybdate ABC transporter substrate-binding protein [Roseomonas elaeocarpi]|uniref:Molybdate ABC transporter substrate-binding protein n=1 Tax=Roseomonas elaeocarpi TaxID=907779 RepID=A0ABV6JMR5_9PROT